MRPAQRAGRRAEGVDLAVRRPDVEAAVGERRCRVEAPVAVEAPLPGRSPELLAGRGEAVHVPVIRADVKTPGDGCDCALDRTAEMLVPDHAPVVGVERPDVSVPVADVETVADEKRRALGGADRVLPVDLSVARGE